MSNFRKFIDFFGGLFFRTVILFAVIITCVVPLSVIAGYSRVIGDVKNLSGYPSGSSESTGQLINESMYSVDLISASSGTSVFGNWDYTLRGDSEDVFPLSDSDGDGYRIVGEEYNFSLIQTPINSSLWTRTHNPDFPSYPDKVEENSTGLCVYHYWDEGADQSVAVNWDMNISLPVNMSDYVITSASVSAVVNASVATPSVNGYSRGVDSVTDYPDNTTQMATGDYVRFYVLISDISKHKVYEIAYNQTYNLGQDIPPISQMGDTLLIPVPEDTLIIYLMSVLSTDYRNFTVTLGMRIWCEDNFPQDSDEWYLLVIKSLNLTFTYRKKIDRLTFAAWEKICPAIDEDSYSEEGTSVNILILSARLGFEYRIDREWIADSPNSELRVSINNITLGETIGLTGGSTEFAPGREGGFDVTTLIMKNINTTVGIGLYIGDEFLLAENISVYIKNIFLNVTYKVVKVIPLPPPALPPYGFDNDFPGQNPNTVSMDIEEPADSGFVSVGYTPDWGKFLIINKTGGDERIYISDNVNFGGNTYPFGSVSCMIFHSTGLYSIKLVGTSGEIARLDFWNGTIGNYMENRKYGTYPTGEWFNLTVLFDISRGWMFKVNDRNFGGDYGLQLGNPAPGELSRVIWSSSSGPEGVGYMLLDNITYSFKTSIPSGPDYKWLVYVLVGAIGVLVTGFGLYNAVLKYPPPVRKVRALRRRISAGKTPKPIKMPDRETVIRMRAVKYSENIPGLVIVGNTPTSKRRISFPVKSGKSVPIVRNGNGSTVKSAEPKGGKDSTSSVHNTRNSDITPTVTDSKKELRSTDTGNNYGSIINTEKDFPTKDNGRLTAETESDREEGSNPKKRTYPIDTEKLSRGPEFEKYDKPRVKSLKRNDP